MCGIKNKKNLLSCCNNGNSSYKLWSNLSWFPQLNAQKIWIWAVAAHCFSQQAGPTIVLLESSVFFLHNAKFEDALANALHEVSSMHLNTSNTYTNTNTSNHMSAGAIGGLLEAILTVIGRMFITGPIIIIMMMSKLFCLFVCFLTLELQWSLYAAVRSPTYCVSWPRIEERPHVCVLLEAGWRMERHFPQSCRQNDDLIWWWPTSGHISPQWAQQCQMPVFCPCPEKCCQWITGF